MPSSSASAVRARILPPLRTAATAFFFAAAMAVGVAPACAEERPVPQPVVVDPSDLVEGRVPPWRGDRYEIYTIPEIPEFLLFDTESYDFQSLIFKRLAFFVEKRGHTGRIHDYATVDPLRGYKAHNYYAPDLAEFFNVASSLATPLLPEELELRRVLIARGVIRAQGSLYAPGRGGVLSVSREATSALRKLHLGHELTHAVFYRNAAYRTYCYRLWNSVPEELQRFWRIFLAWKDYEVDDTYLLVNEFQAYTLQQPSERVESYFRATSIGSMKADLPEWAGFLDRIAGLSGTPFADIHTALSAALQNTLVRPGERRVVSYLEALVGR
jgi:hypothetical protein